MLDYMLLITLYLLVPICSLVVDYLVTRSCDVFKPDLSLSRAPQFFVFDIHLRSESSYVFPFLIHAHVFRSLSDLYQV